MLEDNIENLNHKKIKQIRDLITEKVRFDPKNEFQISDIDLSFQNFRDLEELVVDNFGFDPKKKGNQISLDCQGFLLSCAVVEAEKEMELTIVRSNSDPVSDLDKFGSLTISWEKSFQEVKNEKPDSSSFIASFFYLIPRKFREEYKGELLENRSLLKKKCLPKWWINIITICNFLTFLGVSHWEWLQDLVTSIFESIKELIP